jgi:hypothetical protein
VFFGVTNEHATPPVARLTTIGISFRSPALWTFTVA